MYISYGYDVYILYILHMCTYGIDIHNMHNLLIPRYEYLDITYKFKIHQLNETT